MRGLLCPKKIEGARTESEERYSIEFKVKQFSNNAGNGSVERQGLASQPAFFVGKH